MKETETEPRLLTCSKLGQIEIMVWKSFYNDYRSRKLETSRNELTNELMEYFYHTYFSNVAGSRLERRYDRLRGKVITIASEIKDESLAKEVENFLFFLIQEASDFRRRICKY